MKAAFFTTPKFFDQNNIVSQINSFTNVLSLKLTKTLTVFGEEGDQLGKKVASHLKIKWHTKYRTAPSGAPLLNDLFKTIIQIYPDADFYIYFNSDILFVSGLPDSLVHLNKKKGGTPIFACGQRWDTDIIHELINWERMDLNNFQNKIKNNGNLHDSCGIDYFIFEKNTFHEMPDFIVARATYDNVIVGHSIINNKIMDWDLSETIFAAHQNHPYFVNKLPVKAEKIRAYYTQECEFNKRPKPFLWNELANIDQCNNKLRKNDLRL
jgi:hypothetical protein